ncbi:MAG: PAS domain-containing sensor histidine kinase [Candidatus Lokiarchaeota archaeon]
MREKTIMDSIRKSKIPKSPQKEIEREHGLYNKNLRDLVFKQDKDLNIVYVSPSVYNLFGYTIEEALKLKLPNLMTKESLAKAYKIYNEMLELARENHNLNIPLMEFEYIRKDGTSFWGELKVAFDYDSTGKISGSTGILRDITERKKYQDLLKLSENRYRDAYERAEFYKDLFTHDMTNILQNVQSYAELTEILLEGSLDANLIKDYMYKIKEQITRSSNLISNVKILFNLDEEKVKFKSIDLNSVFSKIIGYVKDSNIDKEVQIILKFKHKNYFVKADDLLFDLFENLLLNSIKHNDNKKVHVEIIIDTEKLNNTQYIKIQIIDNARGIPDQMKEVLFDFNKQNKDYSRGAGIGLILVKKIIERYNGIIQVEDRDKVDYKKGSNFIVYLPEYT